MLNLNEILMIRAIKNDLYKTTSTDWRINYKCVDLFCVDLP